MAPESLRARLTRAFTFAALLLVAATPAHALRVLDWNFLNYPGTSAATRDPSFRTVLQVVQADIIVAEEIETQAGVTTFLTDVLDVIEPGQWAAMPFIDGNDTDAALFYKPAKFSPPTQAYFYPEPTAPLRLIHEYIVHPLGYTSPASEIRLHACHLKASTGFESTRLLEATGWRNRLNTLPAGTHVLCLGDYNFYNGNEPGFLKLLESQADNDGRLYDPLGLQGLAWQDNASMAAQHTQSPCRTAPCAPGAATGGMDDRFDLILATYAWNDGTGYELIPGTYRPVGNDGLHLNKNITEAPTLPEGAAFAAALKAVSDHLPVRVDIQVPAIAAVAATLDLGTVIGGASVSLAVANVAIAPADGLTYSLSAPLGFAAPAGMFELLAGGATNHVVSTTPGGFGTRVGTLLLDSDDLDNPSRGIALAANVLDHAHPSLDSTVEQTAGVIEFGTLPPASFAPRTVAVHDFGYSPAQAKLKLDTATIAGGDGHFSLVSGDAEATVADVGQRFEVAFDPAGATADSQYTATLTFTATDEPLPGATAVGPLSVAMSATVGSTPLATPAALAPALTRLHAAVPNPLAQRSSVSFDVSRRADVRLDVIDLAGRRVATLEHRTFEPGRYSAMWSGHDEAGGVVAAGVYFIRMSGDAGPPQSVRLAVVR